MPRCSPTSPLSPFPTRVSPSPRAPCQVAAPPALFPLSPPGFPPVRGLPARPHLHRTLRPVPQLLPQLPRSSERVATNPRATTVNPAHPVPGNHPGNDSALEKEVDEEEGNIWEEKVLGGD